MRKGAREHKSHKPSLDLSIPVRFVKNFSPLNLRHTENTKRVLSNYMQHKKDFKHLVNVLESRPII